MRLSYARGPEQPLLDTTIDQAVRNTAERFPDREAVVSRHQNRRLTWRQFHSDAERVARGLSGMGLQSQDRVGISASNRIEWLLLQVGYGRSFVAKETRGQTIATFLSRRMPGRSMSCTSITRPGMTCSRTAAI